MNLSGPRCERCGEPARVHITSEVVQDGGVRHLCLTCADQIDEAYTPRSQFEPPRRSDGGRGVHAGLSFFADWIGIGRSAGFGWKQYIVLALGLLLAGLAR